MNKPFHFDPASVQIRPYFFAAIGIWTFLIVLSLFIQIIELKQANRQEMVLVARNTFDQDLNFHNWATQYGGVYVLETKESHHNLYSNGIAERDILTTSGRKLTLISPAEMLREVYEISNSEEKQKVHITSLKPLGHGNVADDWEIEALKRFESGQKEVASESEINGKEYFRLMRPLEFKESCLNCHGSSGHQVDQIAGGISVSFPTDSHDGILQSNVSIWAFVHLIVWALGLLGILFGRNHFVRVVVSYDEKQNDLIKGKEKAEESDKSKSIFLSKMSHEIRTPMNAIVGYADLLKEGELTSDEQREALTIISRNGNHLVEIINDLLDLSRFETQNLVVIKQPFDLRKIIQESFESSVVDVDQKKVCPLLRIDDGLAKHYLGDAVRIRQIIVNLLNNAVKFTKEGTIALKVQVKERHESLHEINFLFEDSGVGMSAEYQTHIFKPFSQEDSTLSRRHSGAGLGMAIVKRLMDAMGGKISVRSEQGAGTIFDITLTFPVLSEEEELNLVESEISSEDGKYPHWVGKKILVVEDTASSAMILLSWLKKTNCELVFAENGEEALLILEKQKFDLVLMDIQMPIIDGMTAAKQIRLQGKSTPLIALSAHAFAEHRKAALEVGFNGYIVKPFHWQDVRAEITRLLVPSHHN